MKIFLKEVVKGAKFEMLIDSKIFSIDLVLKAAYNFLDKWYFFFFIDEDKNIVLQFTTKDWIKDKPENIIWEFSDELLSVYLRDKLEKDNREIREKIVWAAIANSLDTRDYVEINTDVQNDYENTQIDFDKDIDEILKEIENDPELKIDEDEIERILKEIEEESENDLDIKIEEKPVLNIDLEGVKEVKEKFKKEKKSDDKGKNKTKKKK